MSSSVMCSNELFAKTKINVLYYNITNAISVSKRPQAFGTLSSDPLPGLRSLTPLGDFHLPDPLCAESKNP